MILVSHPTANQFSRNLLSGLVEQNRLHSFHTTIAWDSASILNKILPVKVREELSRRSFSEEIQSKTHTYPFYEWGRLLAGKIGWGRLTQHEAGKFCLDAVYRQLDIEVARFVVKAQNLGGVYAYEDGALTTFQEAKKRNITCFYDLPIAYWEFAKNLYLEEANRIPNWADTLLGDKDSIEKCQRKSEELALADKIICPSAFVANSIPGHLKDDKDVVVAPFGTPLNQYYRTREVVSEKIKVLFVGSMSQRKGLADLFAAMKMLNTAKVELHVLGSPAKDLSFYKEQFPELIYHPTRPHEEVLKLMGEADLFVLPSIVEGRAQVIQEAMSQGLPIIITSNTGGCDLVVEEKTGFLVPIRAPEKIAEKIEWFIQHSSEIPTMRKAAIEKAKNVSWADYQKKILEAVSTV